MATKKKPTITTPMEHSKKVSLSPPWYIYYRKLQALFGDDYQIQMFFDEGSNAIKMYVDNADKADAIGCLLPASVTFGDVYIEIQVIPTNGFVDKASNYDMDNLFFTAFYDNPAFCDVKTYDDPFMSNPMTYVTFAKKVVQFYTDNIEDIHGLCSTLYQDIAKDVLTPEHVFYCTAPTEIHSIHHYCVDRV